MSAIRQLVRGTYDLQKLRIQIGNRIVGNWKVKAGQEPGTKEQEMDAEAKKILATLRLSYRRLTDGLVEGGLPKPKKFLGDGVIDTYAELVLVRGYVEMERQEALQFRYLEKVLADYSVWSEYLIGVKGCGPAMAGVLISEIDISKAKYPSSLWKYAGLDVAEDGMGRSKKEQHLVEVFYINKDGEEKTRKSITFNPFLKTKLVGVLGPCFIKAGSEWSDLYRQYKNRLENHPYYGFKNEDARKAEAKAAGKHKIFPMLHRHNMAMRYMIKQFLVELHTKWRVLEGYPPSTPYSEGKLGMKHARQH